MKRFLLITLLFSGCGTGKWQNGNMHNKYIVRVNSGHGSQFAIIEYNGSGDPPLTGLLAAVECGPYETAEAAWTAWHKRQGSLKT
jgi:hypothetical protein